MTEQPELRLVVTRGGEPTPEQAAALVLGMSRTASPQRRADVMGRWQRAALREGIGGAPIDSPQSRPHA